MAPLKITPRRRKAGFTLLEMILAVAVLASVAMLGSALWMQSGEASALSQSRERGLHLQRVGALLRDQWADRKVMTLGGEESRLASGGVSFGPGVIEFTSATPILHPESPLVRVRYLLRERDDGLIDLVYSEQPVLRFGSAETDLEERRSLMVLVEGCEAIRMSRFGPMREPEKDDEAGGRRSEEDREQEMEQRPMRRSVWEAFDEPIQGRTDAVRLDVRYRGEEAVWVFVARPSR